MSTNGEIVELLAKLANALVAQQVPPKEAPPRVPPERVLLTAEEAAERLGVGRTLMYRLIRTGEIESVRIGRLRRVPVGAIQDYAARIVREQNAA